MRLIDNFLNKITMYRLTLYSLIFLLMAAGVFSLGGKMSFGFLPLLGSTLFLVAACWVINKIFSWAFDVPANVESVYITSLILALIVMPQTNLSGYVLLFWVSALAMGSKFILAIYRKHIFNPAALAVAVTALTLGQQARWWVGNMWMLIPVLIVGVLVVRKVRRWDMVYAFIATAVVLTLGTAAFRGSDLYLFAKQLVVDSPLLFFAFIMLTEPLTAPPTLRWQVGYGILVGILFAPFTHIGTVYFTPEQALLVGNVFSYIVSPKHKLMLKLKEKIQLGPDMVDFVFESKTKMPFRPGQYMEWTLRHKADSRGNRRYFTIASSPTENDIRMGVKFYENPSSFKKKLLSLNQGDTILAGQLAGDFTLPHDAKKKLVFIAGGIGITPFRSMVKYLLDKNERRDVMIFYSNRNYDEIAYTEVLNEAYEKLGIPTVHTLTESAPADWQGEKGRVDAAMVSKYLPSYREYIFYISGTHAMVSAMEDMLKQMGVPGRQIKIDFFPGFV